MSINNNTHIDNEQIWKILEPLMTTPPGEYDNDYKTKVINGYKLCKDKTYNFSTFEEEEKYLMNVTAEEEIYYYEIIWEKYWNKDGVKRVHVYMNA